MTKKLAYLIRSNEENHQLTKEALETALLLLLKEKSLKAINITDLVAKAGVARNSFYRNYGSKEAILQQILTERFATLSHSNQKLFANNPQLGLHAIFEFIEQDKSFYQILLKEGFRHILEEEVYRYLPQSYEEIDNQRYYRNRFVSAGMTRLICDWLDADKPESVDDMVTFLFDMMKM